MHISAPVAAMGGIAFLSGTVLLNLLVTDRLLEARRAELMPQIVTVDAAEALLRFAQSRPAQISEEDWAAQLVNLNARIGPAALQMSEENGVVVLNSAAVLTGAPNFTDRLMDILEQGGALR